MSHAGDHVTRTYNQRWQTQQKQQQQQQAESEMSTRNAGKSSLNDILTSNRRQSIDIQLFKQLFYNTQDLVATFNHTETHIICQI